jgi:hypothetical protein|tara:strand:+ start:174 stop:581 length:408 start_codon:yes stop_codon:yes gene_type:complete
MAKTKSYLLDVKKRRKQAEDKRIANKLEDAMNLTGDPVMQSIGVARILAPKPEETKEKTKKGTRIRLPFDPSKTGDMIREMIDEETEKAKDKKGKQVKGTRTARKGGLIRSKPRRDGIAKKGKTKGRIIRGVFNK